MIKPARMKEVTIAATQRHKGRIIDELHEGGFMHIKKAGEPGPCRQEESADGIRALLSRAERLIGAIEEKRKKSAVMELLAPEISEEMEMGWKGAGRVLAGLKGAERAGSEIDGIKKEIQEKRALAEEAGKISGLGVDVRHLADSELLRILPMRIGPENRAQLEKRLPENAHLETEGDIAVLIGLKEEEEQIKNALKGLNYELIKAEGKGKPSDILKKTLREIKELEKKEALLERKKEKEIGKRYPELLAAREALRIEKEKREIAKRIGHTQSTFIIEGWVPAKELAGLEKALHGIAKEEIEILSEEPEDAPVQMENPRLVRPFEMVTEMFSLPKYNSIDPTFIMAPMFALFFGLMLTDAAYGLFLLAGALLVRNGIGRVNRNARDLADILILCGLSTIGWGILTAGYLGDLPRYLFGKSPAELAVWVDPLADPIAVLAAALAIGVIHLNMGIVIGIWDRAGKGELKAALREKGPWILLELGLFILGTHRLDVMRLPQEIGYALIGIGISAMVLEEGLFGVMRPIELSGSVLSYARLLALALSTSGIAMTVNMLSSMAHSVPIVGGSLMVLIFALGHLMNMTMNGLGAFIHSMRLHFVEFFGAFYEGGGEKFTPFKAERRYTKRT